MWPFWSTLKVWICLGCSVTFGVVGKKISRAKPVTKTRELDFASVMRNVSVQLGQDAEFTCKLKLNNRNLHFQLVWIKLDTQTILAIEKQLVQNNPRISVTQQERLEFTLRIKQTQPDDAGVYACRINTKPFSQMRAHLNIKVAPSIVASDTTEQFVGQEGTDALLKCKATGNPSPAIIWTRDDGGFIRPKGMEKTPKFKGANLVISRLSRTDMATYHCLAHNGVLPSVSQKIIVKVEFPPAIWMDIQYVAAWIGGVTEIRCNVEANPTPILMWYREGNVLTDSPKYTLRQDDDPKATYRTKMTLVINNIDEKDFGEYICRANNNRGSADGAIKLFETDVPKRGNVPRGQSETNGQSNQSLTSRVRCHWSFQQAGRADCTPIYAILLLLPDNNAIYDSQQMDRDPTAWASDMPLGSKRKGNGTARSAGDLTKHQLILFGSCLLGVFLWKVFAECSFTVA